MLETSRAPSFGVVSLFLGVPYVVLLWIAVSSVVLCCEAGSDLCVSTCMIVSICARELLTVIPYSRAVLEESWAIGAMVCWSLVIPVVSYVGAKYGCAMLNYMFVGCCSRMLEAS